MKNDDHSFKLLAAIIIAGLITACLPSTEDSSEKSAAHATESSPASRVTTAGAE